MRGTRTISFVLLGALALAACSKKGEPEKQAPEKVTPAKPDPVPAKPDPAPVTPEPTAVKPPDDKADYVRVLGNHNPPKPTDPVTLSFDKFTVVKADFDPAKVEGGTAEITLEAASLSSNSDKRSDHVRSPDYLDVAKFPTITIKVGDVKKTGDKTFSATADVSAHGVSVTKWPVSFEVIETLPDGIRIKGSHKFKRSDFQVGKGEVAAAGEKPDSTQDAIEIQLQLTLKKT